MHLVYKMAKTSLNTIDQSTLRPGPWHADLDAHPEKSKLVTSNGYPCLISRKADCTYSASLFIPCSHPIVVSRKYSPECKGIKWPNAVYQLCAVELKDFGKCSVYMFNFNNIFQISPVETDDKFLTDKNWHYYTFEDVLNIINQATKCAEAYAMNEGYSISDCEKLLELLVQTMN